MVSVANPQKTAICAIMEAQVKTAPAVLVTPFIRGLTPDKEGLMPQSTNTPTAVL